MSDFAMRKRWFEIQKHSGGRWWLFATIQEYDRARSLLGIYREEPFYENLRLIEVQEVIKVR